MTGKELIEYIQTNRAEDMLVCVQYRDGGGLYNGADDAMPSLGHVVKRNESNDYNEYNVIYRQKFNAIIL